MFETEKIITNFPKKILSKYTKYLKSVCILFKNITQRLIYHGNNRYCPVCKRKSRKFKAFGIIPRQDAQCIYCGALERHRFLMLFLHKKSKIFDFKDKRMLHVAPELSLESTFRHQLRENYITADLNDPRAMVRMDICDIQYPDCFFDIIYCSHVLEHVPDDRRALKEFYRVLKKSGWAILNVPITCEKTFEDSKIIDPKQRLEIFGKEDHVRCYGPDYIERLYRAGFSVEVIKVGDLCTEVDVLKMGLTDASGEIYFCTK